MTINAIGYNQVSFGNFYASPKAAYELAAEFIGKPALEKKFMQNIVESLSHTKMYDVFVDGDSVSIANKTGNGVMSIVQPGSTTNLLGIVYDYGLHCRNAIKRHSYVVPTNNFEKDGYLLHSIETAKNIIFDKEALAASYATKTYANVASETLEQKADRLTSLFKFSI